MSNWGCLFASDFDIYTLEKIFLGCLVYFCRLTLFVSVIQVWSLKSNINEICVYGTNEVIGVRACGILMAYLLSCVCFLLLRCKEG